MCFTLYPITLSQKKAKWNVGCENEDSILLFLAVVGIDKFRLRILRRHRPILL